MDISIKVSVLDVKKVEGSSGIFSGENYHSHWTARVKNNQGIGSLFGVGNALCSSLQVLMDNDFIDTPVYRKKNP